MKNFSLLKFNPGNKYIFLNEITGLIELLVSGTNSIDEILLIDECINKKINSEFVVTKASDLTIPDRERVLATLYENTYGPKIETVIHCQTCNESFDIDFSLVELIENLKPNTTISRKEVDGIFVFTTKSRLSFRLCTGMDELAVMGMCPEDAEIALLLRCLIEGDKEKAMIELPKVIQQVAPQIDTDVYATCPNCETGQKFHFNFQNYFLDLLIREKKLLTDEINHIATNYNWGVNEILSMPRSLRQSILLKGESNYVGHLKTNKGQVTIKGNVKVTVDAPQIDLIENASHPIVFGDELINYLTELTKKFNSHLHPGEKALGTFPVTPAPPVPPMMPPTPGIISTKVKTD